MDAVVLTLVVHSQLCSDCALGKPCADAERLHDLCIEREAKAAAARTVHCIALVHAAA